MKRLNPILLIIIILLPGAINAQGISIGARTGASRTKDLSSHFNTWDKGLFIRYETHSRFAFELKGIQYNYAKKYSAAKYPMQVDNTQSGSRELLASNTKYNLVDLIASIQYDISCPYLQQHCPLMKNLKNFIGINVGIGYSHVKNSAQIKTTPQETISTENYRKNYLGSTQLGISYTCTYKISRQLYITSVASYMINGSVFSSFNPNAQPHPDNKLSLRFGVGYSL